MLEEAQQQADADAKLMGSLLPRSSWHVLELFTVLPFLTTEHDSCKLVCHNKSLVDSVRSSELLSFRSEWVVVLICSVSVYFSVTALLFWVCLVYFYHTCFKRMGMKSYLFIYNIYIIHISNIYIFLVPSCPPLSKDQKGIELLLRVHWRFCLVCSVLTAWHTSL